MTKITNQKDDGQSDTVYTDVYLIAFQQEGEKFEVRGNFSLAALAPYILKMMASKLGGKA